ncbi:hypothetical protein PMIN04_005769 [Paraphaeosphaeria minitans]
MDDNSHEDFSDLVDWLAGDTVQFVGAGNNTSARHARPSLRTLAPQQYVSPYSFHQPHSDTSAPNTIVGSSPYAIQPDSTQGRPQDEVREDEGSDHTRHRSFLPREEQHIARPPSMVQMPPAPVAHGAGRGAPQFEYISNIPQPGITTHGGIPGGAGHYSRAAPHSTFEHTGNAAQHLTTADRSEYATHGLPNFLEDTAGFLQDWAGTQDAQARAGRMPPPFVPASLLRTIEATDALVSLQQASQQPPRRGRHTSLSSSAAGRPSSSCSTSGEDHDYSAAYLSAGQQYAPPMTPPYETSSSPRRPSISTHVRNRHTPLHPAEDARSGRTGFTLQPSCTFNPYTVPNQGVPPFNNNPYMARSGSTGYTLQPSAPYPGVSPFNNNSYMASRLPSIQEESAFVPPSRGNTRRQATFAPFVPDGPSPYSAHQGYSGANPYGYSQDYQRVSHSLPEPTIGDLFLQIHDERGHVGSTSQSQPYGYVQPPIEPDPSALRPEQRIVTDYMEYHAPATLYEIVPEATGCQHAQAWLLNVTSDPQPSPTLIPEDVTKPNITARFHHATEGFIAAGNPRSLLVLHNATNPFLGTAPAASRTTTIGTYGYHWFADDWIHFATFAPDLSTWLADVERKGYIRKAREWAPDMSAREKRFHKAYWTAANRRALGGLLRRAPLDNTVDPDAVDQEEWSKMTVADLDGECGYVGEEDRKDAWTVIMGEAEGIGAMNQNHIVCGDPEGPLYEQLLRFERLRESMELRE